MSASKTEVGSYFITNYPPYSQWTAEEIGDIQAAMDEPPADVPLGLYLHIPFCRKRCKFCYYRVFTDKNAAQVERYMAALSREIEITSRLPCLGERPFRFVYFGGGTPSFLSSRQLDRLVERLRANISWDLAEEVTFECEPGTLTEAKVKTLKKMGVTRMSLGVEHFDDAILRENGRAHESPEIGRAWEWITAADFDSTNIDIIAGMVGETEDKWQDCVRRAIALQPDSVTAYQMELPYNTVYSQQILDGQIESPVADWPTKRRWVAYALDELESAGYSVTSTTTAVRDPDRVQFAYRDNLWLGSDLVAAGVASFGHISGVHYQNQAQWPGYLEPLERGELPVWRALRITPLQAMIRQVILLLKRGWLDRPYFREKYGVDIVEHWPDVWRQYERDGLATINEDRIELTRDALLKVDTLLPPFFEPEHQGVRYT
jgi:oxygen-independent coproporphyrinogen-3 oxidase